MAHIVGRSHRSRIASDLMQQCVTLMRSLLDIPPSYAVCFINGSATAAVEAAIYSLITGDVSVVVNGVFSRRWCEDVCALSQNVYQFSHEEMLGVQSFPAGDVVFCACETMNAKMIHTHEIASRKADNGLLICDATSVVFGIPIDCAALDAVAFSLQKMLGCEPGIGVLVLSPEALQRAQDVDAMRHIPHLLNIAGMMRTTQKYSVIRSSRIDNVASHQMMLSNTISLCLMQEFLENMQYLQDVGGVHEAQNIIAANYQALREAVQSSHILELAYLDERSGASASVDSEVKHVGYIKYREELLRATRFSHDSDYREAYSIVATWLEENDLAYDIFSPALPCFRFWLGPWIDSISVRNLVKLLEKAFHAVL